jgi:hypothetical protein
MKTKFQCRLTSALTTLSAAAGTKTRTLQLSLIATALLALSTIASPARADSEYIDRGGWRHDSYGADRGGWRQDSREIRQDRRELRGDYRELARDRADFQRAQARGDIIGMFRERREIRLDMREIRRDQAELHHDLHAVRHDFRQEPAPRHLAQAVNRQGPRQQPASSAAIPQPATTQQNNGRHPGREQDRGNPHNG